MEGGKKKFFKPPRRYMRKHLRAKDFDKSGAVNVDDMDNVTKVKCEKEGNSLSDLRRMDMLNDTDNYIIICTFVSESCES